MKKFYGVIAFAIAMAFSLLLAACQPVEWYYVSFDGNGAILDMETIQMENGKTIILPENAFDNGVYGFLGWDDGDEILQPGQKVAIRSDVNYQAVWGTPVTLDFGDHQETFFVQIGQEITVPSGRDLRVDVPDGYVFYGWGTDDQAFVYGDSIVAGEPITLHVVLGHNVSVTYNDVTQTKLLPDGYEYEFDFEVPEGYEFYGMVEGNDVYDLDTVITVDRDYDFVATLGHKLGVTIDGVREEKILPVDYTMSLEEIEDATDKGRTFMGWDVDGKFAEIDSELTIDKDHEITAVYGYKVTTYADNAVEVNVYREDSEVAIPAPAAANIPEGKQFYVWDDAVNEEEYAAGDIVIIDKDYEFDAVWGYNITINVNESSRVIVYPENAGYKFQESDDLYNEGEDIPYKYYYGWEIDGEDGYFFEGEGFTVDKDYEITVVYGHYVRYLLADDFNTNPDHDTGWFLAPENGYAVEYYVLPEDMEGTNYRFYGWWDYNNYWDNYGEPYDAWMAGLIDFETFYYDYYLVYEDVFYNIANQQQDIVYLTEDKVFWAYQGFDVTIISEGETLGTDFVPEGSLDWPVYANAIEPEEDPDLMFYGFKVNSENDYTDAIFKYNWAAGGGMDVISGSAIDSSVASGSIYVYEDIVLEFIWGYSVTIINGYYAGSTGYVIDYAYDDVVIPGTEFVLPEWTQPTNSAFGEYADPDYTFYAWYDNYTEELYLAGETITILGEFFFEPQRGYTITVHGDGIDDYEYVSPEYYGIDWADMLDQILGAPENLDFYGIRVNSEDGYYEDALYKFTYFTGEGYYFVYESGFSYATNYSSYFVYVFGDMDIEMVWGAYMQVIYDNDNYEDVDDVFAVGDVITLIEPEMPEGDGRLFYGWFDYNYYNDNFLVYVKAYQNGDITLEEAIALTEGYEDKYFPAGTEIEITENAVYIATYTYHITITDGEEVEEYDIIEGEEIYLNPNADDTFYGWSINGETVKQLKDDDPIELVMDTNYEIVAVYGYYVIIDFAGLADTISDVYLPGTKITLPESVVPDDANFYGWYDYTFEAAYKVYAAATATLEAAESDWDEAYNAFEQVYNAYEQGVEGVTIEDVLAAYELFELIDDAYTLAYAEYEAARANAIAAMDDHEDNVYFDAGDEIELDASYYLLSTYTYHFKYTDGEEVIEDDYFPEVKIIFSAIDDLSFYGWNIDGETTQMYYDSDDTIEIQMDQNHEVEAVYGCYVIIDFDGLDDNTYEVYLPGTKINLPEGVAPDGAKFFGWYDATVEMLTAEYDEAYETYTSIQGDWDTAYNNFSDINDAFNDPENETVTIEDVMEAFNTYTEVSEALVEANEVCEAIYAKITAATAEHGEEEVYFEPGAEVELGMSYYFFAIYTYSVTFTIGENEEVIDVPSGTDYELQPVNDYSFYGWIVEDELTKQILGSDVKITLEMNKNYEVEAVFGKYVVINDAESDLFYDVYLDEEEVSVTLPDVEAPEGKTFLYWIDLVHFNEHYADEDFEPAIYHPEDVIEVAQNYFFSAVYGYKVMLDGQTKYFVEGDIIDLEAEEDYTFYGWDVDGTIIKQIYGDETVSIAVLSDLVINSVYGSEVQFVNGEDITHDVIIPGDDGIEMTAIEAPEGKQFYAWRLANAPAAVDYMNGEVFAIDENEEPAESYVFNAIFGYNITVDEETSVLEEGTVFTLPVLDEVPEGEVFYGWTVDDQTVEYFDEDVTIDVDGDHVIQRVTGYEVTVIIGEEEVVSKYQPETVVAISAPAATQIPEGKVFYGWKITRGEVSVTVKCIEDATLEISAYDLTVDCAITVEAVWGYTITYAKTSGDPLVYVYEEGSDVTVLTFYQAFGVELSEMAVFAGWKVNESEDFFAEGFVITAIDQNYELQATIYY